MRNSATFISASTTRRLPSCWHRCSSCFFRVATATSIKCAKHQQKSGSDDYRCHRTFDLPQLCPSDSSLLLPVLPLLLVCSFLLLKLSLVSPQPEPPTRAVEFQEGRVVRQGRRLQCRRRLRTRALNKCKKLMCAQP